MFADIAASQPIRVLSLRYFNPIGADPKMRTGLQLRRPTHALGQMIQASEEGVPFLITGTGLADQRWYGPAGLHPRLGPGRGARGRADPVRRPARAGDGHQPGQRRGHHGPGTCSPRSTGSPTVRSRRVRPAGGPVTWPALTPASTARSGCWAGGRSTTSPRASAIRSSGPRSATRILSGAHTARFRKTPHPAISAST